MVYDCPKCRKQTRIIRRDEGFGVLRECTNCDFKGYTDEESDRGYGYDGIE